MANKASGARLALGNARKKKDDEFYTRMDDIENELENYSKHFRGKIILCNADNPFESNFIKYFISNFNRLGIKELIATYYCDGSYMVDNKSGLLDMYYMSPHKAVFRHIDSKYSGEDIERNDVYDILSQPGNNILELNGDGDFRSDECLNILNKSDVVVTNPPFSLFRDYVSTLIDSNKKFIILGNNNAIGYKNIFPLIKCGEIWMGSNTPSPKDFYVPEYRKNDEKVKIDSDGKYISTVPGACWFTNLDFPKRHQEIPLIHKYSEEAYPKYDNYNAIEVCKTKLIPYDYYGYMGVPLTFLHRYNPEQFNIVGIMNTGEKNEGIRYKDSPHGRPVVNGVEKYIRILIKRA